MSSIIDFEKKINELAKIDNSHQRTKNIKETQFTMNLIAYQIGHGISGAIYVQTLQILKKYWLYKAFLENY